MRDSLVLHETWSWQIILLSFAVCLKGTDSMLGTTESIQFSSRSKFRIFIAINYGCTMGFGAVWPMHFMGMTAMNVDSVIKYDLFLNILSACLCALGGSVGIYFMTAKDIKKRHVIFCSFFQGLGVILMHYIGMASMRCVEMTYNWYMVSFSCCIAIFVTFVGTIILYLVTQKILRRTQPFILTLAICGMHYTGMTYIKYETTECGHGSFLEADNMPFLVQGMASTVQIAVKITSSLIFAQVQKKISIEEKEYIEMINNLPIKEFIKYLKTRYNKFKDKISKKNKIAPDIESTNIFNLENECFTPQLEIKTFEEAKDWLNKKRLSGNNKIINEDNLEFKYQDENKLKVGNVQSFDENLNLLLQQKSKKIISKRKNKSLINKRNSNQYPIKEIKVIKSKQRFLHKSKLEISNQSYKESSSIVKSQISNEKEEKDIDIYKINEDTKILKNVTLLSLHELSQESIENIMSEKDKDKT